MHWSRHNNSRMRQLRQRKMPRWKPLARPRNLRNRRRSAPLMRNVERQKRSEFATRAGKSVARVHGNGLVLR